MLGFTHIKLCLSIWFEFFKTIALLLGALRDFIVGYSKPSVGKKFSAKPIFTNYIFRVASLDVNVSSKVGDKG